MMWWIPGDYRGDTRCNGLLIKPGQQDTWDEHDLPRGSPGGRRDVTELVRREADEFVAASFPSLAAWIRSDGSAEGGVNLGGSEVTIAFRPSSSPSCCPLALLDHEGRAVCPESRAGRRSWRRFGPVGKCHRLHWLACRTETAGVWCGRAVVPPGDRHLRDASPPLKPRLRYPPQVGPVALQPVTLRRAGQHHEKGGRRHVPRAAAVDVGALTRDSHGASHSDGDVAGLRPSSGRVCGTGCWLCSSTWRGASGSGQTASANVTQAVVQRHLASLLQRDSWMWTDGSADGGVRDGGIVAFIEWPDWITSELQSPAGHLHSRSRTAHTVILMALPSPGPPSARPAPSQH